MKRPILWSVSSVLLLLFLAGCSGGTTTSGPQTVQITENEFSITSSISTFTAGIPYHFVVKNVGQTTHEFIIMPKDEGPMVGENMAQDHMYAMSLANIYKIDPGRTESMDYTFPNSTKGTHPQFVCYVGGHYDQGMKLNVNVNQ